MNAVSSLRIPTAFATALLITGGLFTMLYSMTDVEFDVTPIETTKLVFTRQKADTPLENRREVEKPVRELPPVVEVPTVKGERTEIGGNNVLRLAPPVDVSVGTTRSNFAGVDTDAAPLVRVNPDYPPRAASAGIEGWVQVRYTISASGAVINAEIVDSSPPRVFDDAALKAIARWRYNPKVENGQAVERRGMQTMLRFTLTE